MANRVGVSVRIIFSVVLIALGTFAIFHHSAHQLGAGSHQESDSNCSLCGFAKTHIDIVSDLGSNLSLTVALEDIKPLGYSPIFYKSAHFASSQARAPPAV